jgi:hypothetical protein
MHIIQDSDPFLESRHATIERVTKKAEAMVAKADSSLAVLAKMKTALDQLNGAVAAIKADRDDAAFVKYASAFDSLGRQPKLTKAEFVAARRDAERRAEIAVDYDDAEHRLPERRATMYGRQRS